MHVEEIMMCFSYPRLKKLKEKKKLNLSFCLDIFFTFLKIRKFYIKTAHLV